MNYPAASWRGISQNPTSFDLCAAFYILAPALDSLHIDLLLSRPHVSLLCWWNSHLSKIPLPTIVSLLLVSAWISLVLLCFLLFVLFVLVNMLVLIVWENARDLYLSLFRWNIYCIFLIFLYISFLSLRLLLCWILLLGILLDILNDTAVLIRYASCGCRYSLF